ncbi:unnamed protein product [Mytilus edulis]|uniref:Uncharacterized protein n=1 Tax=Mytilus edulis TaxID=6550 RepID=A0A8S3R5B0_MYTED|nr:unnamed protein product [Mytilus edulis]
MLIKRNAGKTRKYILRNEEVSTDFQFDRFDDEGNAIRVPCDIKFGTTLTRKHLWVEACKEVMLGKFTVTEHVTRNGLQIQFSTKSEGKFVSITFYTNGTILVQGKHTCITWRDKYFSKIRDLVNIKEREVSEASFNYDFDNLAHTEVSIENSQTTVKADFRNDSLTIPKELSMNCENDNNINLEEVSLSSTVIQQNTSAIPPASIVMPKQMSSYLNSTTGHDIDMITYEDKNLTDKIDIVNCLNDHISSVGEKLIPHPHSNFES